MKQKSNQSIGAHLLRSAFYIILVISVSSIPFAVGQRAKQLGRASRSRRLADFRTAFAAPIGAL